MQLSVRVIARADPMVHYAIVDEYGRQIKVVERDCASEIAWSKAHHVKLAPLLARYEGMAVVEEPGEEEPDEAPVAAEIKAEDEPVELYYSLPPHDHPHSHDDSDFRHTHEEFAFEVKPHLHDERYLREMAEHAHKHSHEVPEHEHAPEAHAHKEVIDAITLLSEAITALAGRIANLEKPHDHPYLKEMPEHEHEVPVHGHAAIDVRLKSLEELTETQVGHKHPLQEHSHNEFSSYETRLTSTIQALNAQASRIEADAKAAREHVHDPFEHDHPAKEHIHPEIIGIFEKRPDFAKEIGLHLHEWSEITDDGKGWRCKCGTYQSEVQEMTNG